MPLEQPELQDNKWTEFGSTATDINEFLDTAGEGKSKAIDELGGSLDTIDARGLRAIEENIKVWREYRDGRTQY